MTAEPLPTDRPDVELESADRLGGSWLRGAAYTAAFAVVAALVMKLGAGFGGIAGVVWLLFGVAWASVAAWVLAHRASRLTGFGMVVSVAAFSALFFALGGPSSGLFAR